MQRLVAEDAASPGVQRDALEAIGGVDPNSLSSREKVERVFAYVKSRVSFTDDGVLAGSGGFNEANPSAPVVEVLIRPKDMAAMCENGGCKRVGDCDDFSMYTAALLAALGIPSSFVTVAADQAEPDRFSHVYVAAYPDGERVPMDTSHGPHAGWETDNVTRIQEWPVSAAHGVVALAVGTALVLWWMQGR